MKTRTILFEKGTNEEYLSNKTDNDKGIFMTPDTMFVFGIPFMIDEENNAKKYAYGIKWINTADGMKSPERVGNMDLHRSLPIQSAMKGCIWNRTDGIKYYLNADNWSLKADGTTADLSGTDGDVMVHVPKFYIRYVVDGTTCEVWISQYKITDAWIESPEMVIAAFKGMLKDNKFRSIVDLKLRGGNKYSNFDTKHWSASTMGKCITHMTRENIRTACRNNGTELLCYEYRKNVMYWLPVIEYCNFNSQDDFYDELDENGYHQGMLGVGIVRCPNWDTWNGYNPMIPNGFGIGTLTTSLDANFDNTHKGNTSFATPITFSQLGWNTEDTKQTITSYRGLFEPFGDVHEFIDGVVCRGDKVYATTDVSKFSTLESHSNNTYDWVSQGGLTLIGTRPTTGGYGISLYSDSTNQLIELIPGSVSGTSTTLNAGTYDYYLCATKANDDYYICIGGCASYGSQSGLAFLATHYNVSNISANLGGRSYQLL